MYVQKTDFEELKVQFNSMIAQLTELTTQARANQALTAQVGELTTEAQANRGLNTRIDSLLAQIEANQGLSTKVDELAAKVGTNFKPAIEPYKDVSVTVSMPKDVSLDIFKTLPEFDGNRSKYPTWRSTTNTAIGLLKNHPTSMRYFEALMIIRNKIVGAASNILNNYNTAFNFDAIIDRLDFTYADKRPMYILEQELTVLQQGKMSLDEFFDKVNEKLNAIVNKINMTYKENQTAKAFVDQANEKALRTFITGLNNRKGEVLYASKPQSLPEAYAMLQTIINDQERISYANRFNKGEDRQALRNPQFKPIQHQNRQTENLSINKPSNYQNYRENQQNIAEAMEIDRSSTAVNVVKNQSNRQLDARSKEICQKAIPVHRLTNRKKFNGSTMLLMRQVMLVQSCMKSILKSIMTTNLTAHQMKFRMKHRVFF